MTEANDCDSPDDAASASIERSHDLASLALALFGQRHGIDDLPIPARPRELRPLSAFEQSDFGNAAEDN